METLALFGRDLFGDIVKPQVSGIVAERFIVPPFSVLDTRQGTWQDRKRAWIALGIESEVSHAGVHRYGNSCVIKRGCHGFDGAHTNSAEAKQLTQTSGSLFDPVLCECIYRWFCPPGGQVVDPFAGGSVRGIVAGALGRKYWGSDLRQEQIDANVNQATIIKTAEPPMWICGDSLDTLNSAPQADLVFSCPPYGDLERYSDDPRDISTMEWHTFTAAYKRIILRSVERLKPDRFACFVVGDFRDKRGFYRDFVSLTIGAFQEVGARLYNEAILLNSIGSACLRVSKQFVASRKFAKVHQNILVFCKGDPREATSALADIG